MNQHQFMVFIQDSQITISSTQAEVKITLFNYQTNTIYQQKYISSNLPKPNGRPPFQNINQYYIYLENLHKKPEAWRFNHQQSIIEIIYKQNVKITVKKIEDFNELSKIILSKLHKNSMESNNHQYEISAQIKQIQERHQSNYHQIGQKLKGIGNLFQTMQKDREQAKRQQEKLQRQQQDLLRQLEVRIRSIEQRSHQFNNQLNDLQEKCYAYTDDKIQKKLKEIQLQVQITQKTLNRNILTLKEQFQQKQNKNFILINQIQAKLNKFNLEKIQNSYFEIHEAFEKQIRIKDYEFVPDANTLNGSRKIHYINKRILKNLQDVKDYNKVIAVQPLSLGIHKFRVSVRNIKNNGLLIGVCNEKIKESLGNTTFNDINLISLNSCGFIINRGIINMSNGKIKNGDIIKVVIDTFKGFIRWYCNDIEVALADLGIMKLEKLFPFIGLGYFSDEVQIIEIEQAEKIDSLTQTYTVELAKLNSKYGSPKNYT